MSDLAEHLHVSASTQNQAFCALLFLYRHVLERPLAPLASVTWAKKGTHMLVVLSCEEVAQVLDHLHGAAWLSAVLLYGGGLRLNECLDVRVRDIDLAGHQVMVRAGTVGKDRPVPLPAMVVAALTHQLEDVKRLHQRDLVGGFGRVTMPGALARK